MSEKMGLSEEGQRLFTAIEKGDVAALKVALIEHPTVNILDENSMTPLQHAAYKGITEMVLMLLDHGADVNLCKHQHNYTALHFAGLSGNIEVCLALLMAGAKTSVTNTVNRTAAQMAAFVGHHNCVAIINNYIPKADVDYYTVPRGQQKEPLLPPFLAESFHKFIMQINVHPIKVALNLSNFVGLTEHLAEIKKVLQLMCEREMDKGAENNEVMAFKFHYLSFMVNEILQIQKQNQTDNSSKLNPTELFARTVLKPGKDGALDYLDALLKECVKTFPVVECTLFRQMVSTLTSKDPPTALSVINSAINGQRGFVDNVAICSTCGDEKPAKKCSKCKVVQYCDKTCQKLHWTWHKKSCATLAAPGPIIDTNKEAPDVSELSSEIQNLIVQN